MMNAETGSSHAWAAAVALVVIAVLLLAACEEMVDPNDQDEPRVVRCDADPDWYLNLPIVTLTVGGQMNPPQVPDPDEPGDFDSDWSGLETIVDRYEGQPLTLARFKQLQRDLFATGLLQDGERKWGVEFYALPDLPRRGKTDPRVEVGRCLGVRLEGDAQYYYAQEVQERPWRIVR